MTFVTLIATSLLAMVGWLAVGVWRIGAVSRGQNIGTRDGAALLLIDLQTVFWSDAHYRSDDRSRAQAVILAEIESAKAAGFPVIALRQEWSHPSTKAVARLTMQGTAIAGTPGTELAEPFAALADHVVVKRVQDAFETGELDALLGDLEVGHLRLVGLDLNYCVLKTALAARNRGYEVAITIGGTLASGPAEATLAKLKAASVTIA